MKLQAITDKTQLQTFLVSATPESGAESLASLDWADLLRSEGAKVETSGIFTEDGRLLAVFNAVESKLPFGRPYYYLPRGPIFAPAISSTERNIVWHFLRSTFRRRRALFFRVEPLLAPSEKIGASKVRDLQPAETLLLDLTQTEDELLQACHQKTRYNIRLAEKKGVTIREGKGAADFEAFWRLMKATGSRDSFRIHGRRHYQTLASHNPEFVKLFLAEHDGQVIAAGLFSFFANKAIYLHGASDHEARALMAPYLLQWTVIKFAKARGCEFYDFYGINETKWPGVTRFKVGFGGFRFSYAGAYDIVLQRFGYRCYDILRRLRRLI